MRYIIPALILALCIPQAAKAFYLDNSTMITPTTLDSTFKFPDWFNITASLTIDVKGIRINSYWLEFAPNESTNLTVYNYSELHREFNIVNTTSTPYLEFNISGLNKSTSAEIWADYALAANITTNSSGWLNFVLNYGNLTNSNTTIIINQTVNYSATAAPPAAVFPQPGRIVIGRPTPVNCTFELYPSKLIGTGTPQGMIEPPFTMYIKNLYLNQSFQVTLDWSSVTCYIDYNYGTDFGILEPGDITSYRIGCMTPLNTTRANITVTSSLGCMERLEMELIPKGGAMSEVEVAFSKMSFGDIDGFLASTIGGVSVMMWIIIILIFILLVILVLSTLMIGGR